jgi:hypothetical protein
MPDLGSFASPLFLVAAFGVPIAVGSVAHWLASRSVSRDYAKVAITLKKHEVMDKLPDALRELKRHQFPLVLIAFPWLRKHLCNEQSSPPDETDSPELSGRRCKAAPLRSR